MQPNTRIVFYSFLFSIEHPTPCISQTLGTSRGLEVVHGHSFKTGLGTVQYTCSVDTFTAKGGAIEVAIKKPQKNFV